MSQARIIRWEDPPPRARASGRRDWSSVVAQLREHPGRWALIDVVDGKADADQRRARGTASAINSAVIRAFSPAGSYEAQTRMVGDSVKVYVRLRAATTGPTRHTPEPEGDA